MKIKKINKQPEIRELDSLKQLDDPIKAKINSLIIIAPKELQTVIDFNKYKKQINWKRTLLMN